MGAGGRWWALVGAGWRWVGAGWAPGMLLQVLNCIFVGAGNGTCRYCCGPTGSLYGNLERFSRCLEWRRNAKEVGRGKPPTKRNKERRQHRSPKL